MRGLSVTGAVVKYGDLVAVDGVDAAVEPGEIVALLGASGSGKSSLLRGIAGLEPLAAGRVAWNDEDVTTVPVHKRGFGMMFQDGQLFNHLSVAGNIAYGLYRQPRAARRARVEKLLEVVGLPGYGARPVSELSGGQAQRVALARSLAPGPRLLLLDEPLSALDRNLREHLVGVLGDALRTTGTTALYVTHDQDEAFALADRVGVMDAGRMLQLDNPDTLWRRPVSRRVADFLGYEPFIDAELARRLGGPDAGPGQLVGIGPAGLLADAAGTALPVVEQRYRRGEVLIDVRLPDGQLATVTAAEKHDGEELSVRLDRAGCAVLPG
ncbi:ABC transporter ATP-binding protein [Micropruina sonneratiae]|uniref:ABC transporter ATP-binding protein n=1 Tax=Micropruina sonneratiae TaxID=2986940 RepID=UPI002226F7F7|nr:ABC transporter ATP-binding protein [Micropruina sp. KQZ13P-5]MCW3156443.1 ABC transporter ATP-binding protein [Micropruina sp. KQZ13P-5]